MSSSRSVAAAQRRRAGGSEPSAPSRGSNISINSSQAFTQQIQPGTNGRLAGQHAALQQKLQQQSSQNSGSSKMTVPQAITLITLRLGRVENQLQNLDSQPTGEFNENGDFIPNTNLIDDSLVNTILERIDLLEKSCIDLPNIKQQMDLFKPALIKNTSLTNNITKDIKEMKLSIEQIKNDNLLIRSLVQDLQLLLNPPESEENICLDNEIDICVENNNSLQHVNLKEIIEQELSLT
jgi:hypothetical protein